MKLRIKERYSIINTILNVVMAKDLSLEDATLLLNALISIKNRPRIDVNSKYKVEATISIVRVAI